MPALVLGIPAADPVVGPVRTSAARADRAARCGTAAAPAVSDPLHAAVRWHRRGIRARLLLPAYRPRATAAGAATAARTTAGAGSRSDPRSGSRRDPDSGTERVSVQRQGAARHGTPHPAQQARGAESDRHPATEAVRRLSRIAPADRGRGAALCRRPSLPVAAVLRVHAEAGRADHAAAGRSFRSLLLAAIDPQSMSDRPCVPGQAADQRRLGGGL